MVANPSAQFLILVVMHLSESKCRMTLIPRLAHLTRFRYIDLDLKKSKEGKLYLQLNTFTPKAKAEDDGSIGLDLS